MARRTVQNIARHPSDLYKVSYQVKGNAWIQQDGRRTLMQPETMAIYDTGRPYSLDFPEQNESIVIQIPRTELPLDSTLILGVTAQVMSGPSSINAALLTIVRGALLDKESNGPAGDYHLSRSITELISSIILAETASTHVSDPAREAQLASLKMYAQAHLSNSSLTIGDAANANYVSTRTAQRLFSGEGSTFAAWLRTQRLKRAHHLIASSNEPITDIAHECGFASATHFSRAFREQYGISAREFRLANAPMSSPHESLYHEVERA